MGGRGRLVIRKSGTEPLVRIMGECDDPDLLQAVVGEHRGRGRPLRLTPYGRRDAASARRCAAGSPIPAAGSSAQRPRRSRRARNSVPA